MRPARVPCSPRPGCGVPAPVVPGAPPDGGAYRRRCAGWAGFVIAALCGLMVGCGPPTASGRSDAIPAASPSVSPTSSVPTDAEYRDPTWGYVLRHPASWRDVSASDPIPQQSHDWSNEAVRDVNQLSGLDDQGFLFRVLVSPAGPACRSRLEPSAWRLDPSPVVIDGVVADVARIDTVQSVPQPRYSLQAQAPQGKYCYAFAGVALAAGARDAFDEAFRAALSSFSFGAPVSPPF